MTHDPEKPAPRSWWRRPVFLVTSPIIIGVLAWISTFTGVFQTVTGRSTSPVSEVGSQDHIEITNLPPAAEGPAPVSPAPSSAVSQNVQTQHAMSPQPIVIPGPVPREPPPVLSSAPTENRFRARPNQAPQPGNEWFDEANGAVVDQRPVMHRLAATTGFQGMCVPRISAYYGVAGGIVSNALTRAGNPNCVQATYGDIMSIVVEPCGGELTEVSQIVVERGGFREDGRPWSSAPYLSYSLIANGQETLPLPLGTGGYRRVQSAEFSPVRVSAVRVTVRSPRTTAYKIYERICSIVVR